MQKNSSINIILNKNTDAWGGAIAGEGYQITDPLYTASRTLVDRSIRETYHNHRRTE